LTRGESMFRKRTYKYDWENPEVIQINKLMARTPSISYNSLEEMDKGVYVNKYLLNGSWKFKWINNLTSFSEEKAVNTEDVLMWDDIEVPSLWQLKGYGKPYYLAFDYPPAIKKKKSLIPTIDHEKNEAGIYYKEFILPSHWMGKNIYLFFGAVKSAFHLYINGEKVGYSQGSMTPAEFNITNYVKSGVNKIVAAVYRFSDGTYLEDQDMWFFSGIYRDVYLHCQPNTSIFDFFAYPVLDENYKDAVVNLEIDILNDDLNKYLTLEVYLNPWKQKERSLVQSYKLEVREYASPFLALVN